MNKIQKQLKAFLHLFFFLDCSLTFVRLLVNAYLSYKNISYSIIFVSNIMAVFRPFSALSVEGNSPFWQQTRARCKRVQAHSFCTLQ